MKIKNCKLSTYMLILGSHISIAEGFPKAALKTASHGANAMQIFTKNPRGRGAKPILKNDAEEFKKICKEKNIVFVVAHCSYLLNFAKPLSSSHWSIKDIISDLERINALGGKGVVLHIGKIKDHSYHDALNELIKNLNAILKKTVKLGNLIILENTAGQGSEMGHTIEQLAEVYAKMKKHKRIKFCFDTEHAFAAGYDWRDAGIREKTFKKFDTLIGLKNIVCFHFNDSLKEFGSRVDRHEDIGVGKIGLKALKEIAQFAEKRSIPLLLETPETKHSHKEDIGQIKDWFQKTI